MEVPAGHAEEIAQLFVVACPSSESAAMVPQWRLVECVRDARGTKRCLVLAGVEGSDVEGDEAI